MMQAMRVLHVYSGNLYGGVETLLATLARARAACPAMEPHFALCFPGRLHDELTAAGVPVHPLGPVRVRRPLTVLRARRALGALLRRTSYDVVVCHSAWPLAVFGPVVRARAIPLVAWRHDVAARGHWVDAWARRARPDLVVCNSRFTAAHHAAMPGVPTRVLYCPVTLATRHPDDRMAARAELDTPASAVVIVQAGRLVPSKGHALLLDALALLADVPGWVCWLVGGAQRAPEAAYAARLRARAARAGLADRVRFVGQRDDVARLLAAADIHCQPNVGPEAFGIAFVEALAAGLPVVTTAIGGACEIVDDACGTLVPPDDAPALAAALARLVGDPTLRRRLAAAGPPRARSLCDPAAQLPALGTLLATAARAASTAVPS